MMSRQTILFVALLFCLPAAAKTMDTGASRAADQSEASRVFEKAKPALVFLKVVGTESDVGAGSGSGFVIDETGRVATNYHVVSEVVLKPMLYRLRYTATTGQAGFARVAAIDVANDLAILETDFRPANPLQLSRTVPVRGQTVYSLGYPNRQAATVTQGIYNGPVERRYVERFHFTGPINSGMSGGPALDARGHVFGINVESGTSQQLASYLVPAKALDALILRSREVKGAVNAEEVERQLVEIGNTALGRILAEPRPPVRLGSYLLPGENRLFHCSGSTERHSGGKYEFTSHFCTPRTDVWVNSPSLRGIDVGILFTRKRNLTMDRYDFADSAADELTSDRFAASPDRGPFACRYQTIALQGMRGRAETCVAKRRDFDLFDYVVNLVSIDRSDEQLTGTIWLNTMKEAPARQFIKAILEGVAWLPASTSKH